MQLIVAKVTFIFINPFNFRIFSTRALRASATSMLSFDMAVCARALTNWEISKLAETR